MELFFAILSGVASLSTACFASISERMFFSVMWLIVCFVTGCISIAKFHECSEEYGGSIFFVISQIIVVGFFVVAILDIFNIAGY